MGFHKIVTTVLACMVIVLCCVLFDMKTRLHTLEKTVKDGQVIAKSITTGRVTVLNPNGKEVISLQSDSQDASGYGDGIIIVNEGQGLDNEIDKLKSSVQIRAHGKVGGPSIVLGRPLSVRPKDPHAMPAGRESVRKRLL